MHPAVQAFNKSIESVMRYTKEPGREDIVCPVCHKEQWEKLDHIRKPLAGWSHLSICQSCGFVTFNPQLKDIMNTYGNEPRAQSVSFVQSKRHKLAKHKNLLFKYLRENQVSPKTFLDYGCSDGYLMRAMEKWGSPSEPIIETMGIELNRGHSNWAKYIEDLDVSTTCDLTKIEDNKYDIISLYHVLEHIQKPDVFIDEISKKLTKDGLLYIALPTFSRMDYPDAMKYFKDEHVNYWSDKTLRYFFNLHGFDNVFFDNTQYGTCMIFKKYTNLLGEQNYYLETKAELESLGKCWKLKAQLDEILSASGDRAKAMALANEALSHYDNYPELLIKYAAMFDPVDECEMLEELIVKKPNIYELQLQLGLQYFKQEEYEEAKKWLLKVIDTFGRPLTALSHMAFIEHLLENKIESIKYAQEVVKTSPYDSGAFEVLSNLVMQM